MESNNVIPLLNRVTDLLASSIVNGDIPDPHGRKTLQAATRELRLALETPADATQRMAYSPLQTTVVRIGLDLDLFDLLVEAGPEGRTTDQLVAATGAETVLLIRILRYLAAVDLIGQENYDRYVATPATKSLTIPTLTAGIKHTYDFVSPVFLKLPQYLAETTHQNPTDAKNGPFQYAYSTDLDGFSYITQPQHEKLLRNFSVWMSGQREGRADWLDFFPFEKEILEGFDRGRDAVMAVDIGGGLGHEMLSLKKKFPNLPGKLIVQDLPRVIASIQDPNSAFEPMTHDFFTPQPVKGARFYYFRQILHDWPDDECRVILKETIAAMRRGYSMIVINEMVVPDVGAGALPCQLDLTMLSCLSAMERSERQWEELLSSVGLRIVGVWKVEEGVESVILAVPVVGF